MKSGTETEAGGGREEGGRAVDAKKKQEPHTKMWGIIYVCTYLCIYAMVLPRAPET